MVPTIDQYIATCIRALGEVVLPAIDKSDSMALEQTQLVIGLLALMAEHWDKTLLLEMAELRAHLQLGRALEAAAAGGAATHAALEASRRATASMAPLASVDIPTQAELRTANVALRTSITELLAAARSDGAAEFRSRATALVIAHAAEQNRLARSWFAKSHLDADWRRLPSVVELLTRAAQPGSG